MPGEESNPYAAPETAPEVEPKVHQIRLPAWQVILTGLFVLTGFLSFAIGMFAVAIMSWLLLSDNGGPRIEEMLAGCALYLGLGGAWMLAGWLYWQGRYRFGIVVTLVGLLIPAVLFSILRF